MESDPCPLLAPCCACSSPLALSACPPLPSSPAQPIWKPAPLCSSLPSLHSPHLGPQVTYYQQAQRPLHSLRAAPECLEVLWLYCHFSSTGCKAVSPLAPSLGAGAPGHAPSQLPPSGAPLPAFVCRPPAAEAVPVPPSADTVPAFLVRPVLPALSPAAAA